MLTPMVASISCASTNQVATSQRVCPLQTTYVRLLTRSSRCGQTSAQMRSPAARISLAAHAVYLRRYLAPLRIASLTSNGAQFISPLPVRRRISRYGCMRIVPTSSLTLSLVPSNQAAISYMSRVCRDRTTPLLRTSVMLTRRRQACAPTPARVEEHRPRRRQLRLPLLQQPRPRLQRQLRRRLQLQQRLLRQLQQYPGRHLRRDPVGLRHRGHSGSENNFCRGSCQLPLQIHSVGGVKRFC